MVPGIGQCLKKLIEAAVLAAKAKGDPPPLLSLAWDCQRFNSLPDSGGLNDQDFVTMQTMKVLSNVYDAETMLLNAKGDAIHNLPPSVGLILNQLDEMGINIGGLA